MPFGVRRWPNSIDPRGPAFCWQGWSYGAVPPYLWRASSVGATGVFSLLNTGIILPHIASSPDHYEAFNGDVGPDSLSAALVINGHTTPVAIPTPHTIEVSYAITAPGESIHQLTAHELWPYPIQARGPYTVTVVGGGPNKIPNGITLTPVIFSSPTT